MIALGEAFQFERSEEGLLVGGWFRCIQASRMKLCASRAFWSAAYPSQGHEMLFDAHTHQAQLALEILGEHMQAHLGAHPVERSGEELGGAHPRLQRVERVLDRLTADSNHLGRLIEATLHCLEHCLMPPCG